MISWTHSRKVLPEPKGKKQMLALIEEKIYNWQ